MTGQSGLSTWELTLDPEQCLGPTRFLDCEHASIRRVVAELELAHLAPEARAAALFGFVRDEIIYEFMAKTAAAAYIASRILAAGKGYCVQKAVLLAALGRAAGIPAALVLTDVRDHTLGGRLVEGMGTDILYGHGLTAFHLRGRWVCADASLSIDLVQRKGYRPVQFDGSTDALLPAEAIDGRPHVSYIAFRGLYADLPLAEMLRAFDEGYRGGDERVLEEIGVRPIPPR